MRGLRFACAATVLWVGSSAALACENLQETPTTEEQPQYQPAEETPANWHLAGMGVGGTLLAGVGFVMGRRRWSA